MSLKNDFLNRVQTQTGVDLSPVINKRDDKRNHGSYYLDDLDKRDQQKVKDYLTNKYRKLSDNGGFGTRIDY